MSEFKIEKGVPLVPIGARGNHQTGMTAALRIMEVGDSFTVSKRLSKSMYPIAVSLKPKRFTARTIDTETVRIWRKE